MSSFSLLSSLVTNFPLPQVPSSNPYPPGSPQFNGTTSDDAVLVLDSSYNQVFTAARAMKVNVVPSTKLMDQPMENGAMQTDFRIFNPTELELQVICTGEDYSEVYQQIKTAYMSGDLFIVDTKADTYLNMIIESIPHDEIPDMFDVISVSVKMREVILVQTQYQLLPANQVQNPNDQSTINTGTTTPTPATANQSVAAGLTNWGK
jgi:hypothetical protein